MSNENAEQPASPVDIIRQSLDTRIVSRGRVVLIGLGGIGAQLARPLATFLASLCGAGGNGDIGDAIELVLCDGDNYAPENAYRLDIVDFGNKAEVAGRELVERLAATPLVVRWIAEYINAENVADIVKDGDCVLLACDNHATRKLVGRHCSDGALADVILISGGNDGIENGQRGTYGNVQVYVRASGQDITSPLDRFHPEIAEPADRPPDELSCLELAAAGAPQLSFVNLAVASAMCNALLRLMSRDCRDPMYDEVALDILDASSTPLWLTAK
jgi:molybdopterin/thiamine biosynthesis adenylyltransferase